MKVKAMTDERMRSVWSESGTGTERMRLAVLPWMVAGVKTQYENLRSTSCWLESEIDVMPIEPFLSGGTIERLPLLKNTHKGTLRSTWQALPMLRQPPYDAVLTQVALPLLPFLASCSTHLRPLPAIAYTIDSTPALMDRVHAVYYASPAAGGRKRALRDGLHRFVFRHCAVIVPWSRWAAHSFVADYKVPDERIHVIPPGVDLKEWNVSFRQSAGIESVSNEPFRLLFVGADFERKGGPLLVDVFRKHFREICELHLVTGADVLYEPGIYVYQGLTANSRVLKGLYARCDALVLPTRADCFSLASIEAMACGLPVITCPVGGIPEIVDHGSTGLLIPPDDGRALAEAIHSLVVSRSRSLAMGMAGRRVAEKRFDSERNSRALFALIRKSSRMVDRSAVSR